MNEFVYCTVQSNFPFVWTFLDHNMPIVTYSKAENATMPM